MRDRFQPELGFNLHDQNRRTTVGDTGVLATISLLAVSGDREGTLTPGRARAKRVCSAVARTLEPFVPGGIARYDEDWNPRAFGDNVTAWGTPVVLIESGGVPPGRPLTDLTRLDYVALLTVLAGLVRDDLGHGDPRAVREPRAQRRRLLDRRPSRRRTRVAAGGGRAVQGGRGLRRPRRRPAAAACAEPGWPGASRIREVGDGRLLGSGRREDVAGRLVAPAFAASVSGIAARSWLTAETLAATGRLGVARLRWHVAPLDRPEALEHAARLTAPGRPALEVVDAGASASLLEVISPPGEPSSATIEAALDGLTHGSWRARAAARSLGDLLGELAGAGTPLGAPLIAPDTRASLVILRPHADAALDASSIDLESVFIDGREPGGSK